MKRRKGLGLLVAVAMVITLLNIFSLSAQASDIPHYVHGLSVAFSNDYNSVFSVMKGGNSGIFSISPLGDDDEIIDLNHGAGGKYVVMGFYREAYNVENSIRDIALWQGSDPVESFERDGFTFYLLGGKLETNHSTYGTPIDLNKGAGGMEIYVYVTRDPDYGPPLTGIYVSKSPYEEGYDPVTNWRYDVVDVNEGAGGDYLYLHTTKYASPVSQTYHYLTADGQHESKIIEDSLWHHEHSISNVPDIPQNVRYKNKDYVFLGWREDKEPKASYDKSPYVSLKKSSATYYAVYRSRAKLKYDLRGGSGDLFFDRDVDIFLNAGDSEVVLSSVSYESTLPSKGPVNGNKCFLGWSRLEWVTDVMYGKGEKISFNSDITLYALYSNTHTGNHTYTYASRYDTTHHDIEWDCCNIRYSEGHNFSNSECECGRVCEDHVNTVTVYEPTCSSRGFSIYTCNYCDRDIMTDFVDTVPHDNEVVAHRDATCTADGYNSYKCKDCGATSLEVISSLYGHKFAYTYNDMTHTGFCGVCGYSAGGFHEYEDSCVCICGKKSDEKYHHNYDSVYTEPTCNEDGYYIHSCDVCGDSYTEVYGKQLEHSGGETTCTEWAICIHCGEEYGEEPAGHMEDYDDGTCLTPIHCWVCGEITTPARDEHEWNEYDYCSYCYTGKPYKFYFMDGENELFTADVEATTYYNFKVTENKGDYSFIGWDEDGDGIADYLGPDLPYYIYVDGDKTFNAVYQKVDYALIHYYRIGLDSGEYEISDIQRWPMGEVINLDYDYAYWYDALGWATEPGGEKAYNYGQEITITEHLSLYTVWETFKVTFDLGEGATWIDEDGNPVPESITEAESFYTVPVKPGYKFLYFVGYDMYGSELTYEFYTDEETGEDWMYVSVGSTMTLTAVWEECTDHNYINGKCVCGDVDYSSFAIAEYSKASKTASVIIPEAGAYVVVFADFEGEKLMNLETVPVTVSEAKLESVSITKDFDLGTGDKVMLWKDMTDITPICKAFEVK